MEDENKYQRGKIYKIVDNTNENIYIGSTCEPKLARRLAKHRGHYIEYLDGKRNHVTSFIILENDDYDIVLIENYPCNNIDELRARERYHVERTKCVNKNIPGRKREEYRKIYYENNKEQILEKTNAYKKENMEKIKEYKKQYNQDNKDYFKNYSKVYREQNKEKLNTLKLAVFVCQCGREYTQCNKTRHEKTKYHQNYLNNL